MTSKISFSKLVKRTIKEESSLIFASCVYTVIGVMTTVFELQRAFHLGYEGISTPAEIYIANIFEPGNALAELIYSFLLASLFAFAGLRHLHSKKQSDFYGSLPIKRKTHLTVILTSCLLIFIIPLLIRYLIDIVAVAMTGYLSLTILKYMAFSFLYQILVFLLSWFTAALAVILTGHTFIGLLGLCVFCGYAPVVFKYLVPTYADIYFNTFADVYSSANSGIYAILDFLSPVSASAKLLSQVDMNGAVSWNSPVVMIVLAELVALAAFVYYLYDKRPAEAAGSSMAFPRWNTFWALLFIVPAALYTGILFSSIAYGNYSKMWILPGTIIGVIIFAVIIEFLFDFDIKAVFHHKRRFAACFVICMAFLSVFHFDLFGFDSWTPAKAELETITFDYNGMSFASSRSIGRYIGYGPLSVAVEERSGMSGEDLDAAYDLAMAYASYGNQADEDYVISDYIDEDGSHYQTVIVRYLLKRGQVKTRAYLAPVDANDPLLQKIFEKESFRDDLYIHYSLTPDMITKAEWYNGSEAKALNWNEEEKEKFLEAYMKDLANLTLQEALTENPVSTVRLTVVESDVYDSYIYRSFKNTEAFLKDYQIEACAYAFTEENIKSLIIHGIDYKENGDGQEFQRTITDKDQIRELVPYLVNMDFDIITFKNDAMINYDYSVEVLTQNSVFYTQLTNKGSEVLETFE